MARFHKYEGLGNDFVLLEVEEHPPMTDAYARALCDRRFGVGADGVLMLTGARDVQQVPRMRVWNADGSVPEMCGNGLRCVAQHVADARRIAHGELRVETDAGLRVCLVAPGEVTVDMGVVSVGPARTVLAAERTVRFRDAHAGNPHTVTFDDVPFTRAADVGRAVEASGAFPGGVNVELAVLAPDGALDVVVWERGVGLTLACGTGACAVVAVACAEGRVAYGAPVVVRLPGGALTVTIADGGRATLRGPARRVFVGSM